MKITKMIGEESRYWVTRKPTICPACGEKAVRKSIMGYPSLDDFQNSNIHSVGCIPDLPWPRKWGCNSCDAAFWKDDKETRQHFKKNDYSR